MLPPHQKHRRIAINTALGEDVLLLRSASVTEQLGRPFQMEVDLLCEIGAVNFSEIVGKNATIRLELPNKKNRYFNGFVSRFVQTKVDGRSAHYRATLAPWLWFLTRTSNCRIFQKMKIPDIIMKVFRDRGFEDFEDSLTASYPKWDYCVQYRETDFNFVHRLMEQEGIYYFFKHENGAHKLVLADAKGAHQPYPGYESIKYRQETGGYRDEEFIWDWTVEQSVQPGQVALTDFNFEKPKGSLLSKAKINRDHAMSEFEIFDYPGEYDEQGEGENHYSKIRIEELQARHEIVRSQSDARGIAVGSTFKMADYPRSDQNREYLVVSAQYQIQGDTYEASSVGGSDIYTVGFEGIPTDQIYRPPRTTPKPLIQGPQTAIVVGPKGEEIHTDKHGRVKVKFHWDRYSKADENSSCWIRVSQQWAGKKWGAMYIPRIGQEVVVEFLEGDPDQPIITGRVYNGDAKPPYDLPAEKTKSTLKSNSSKGGGGFNEIRFEDKKGREQVFIHAQRDEDVRVRNNSRRWVGNCRSIIIKKDHIELVEGDRHDHVEGEEVRKIDQDQSETIEGSHFELIKGDDNVEVKGDSAEKIGGDANLKIGKNFSEIVGKSISRKAGKNIQEKAGKKYALQAGMKIDIKAGLSAVIEAGMSMTIKAGAGWITLGPAGVCISGPMVKINSGGAPSPATPPVIRPADPPEAPSEPKDPWVADSAKAGEVSTASAQEDKIAKAKTDSVKVSKRIPSEMRNPKAAVLKQAAESGVPFCEKCEAAKGGA